MITPMEFVPGFPGKPWPNITAKWLRNQQAVDDLRKVLEKIVDGGWGGGLPVREAHAHYDHSCHENVQAGSARAFGGLITAVEIDRTKERYGGELFVCLDMDDVLRFLDRKPAQDPEPERIGLLADGTELPVIHHGHTERSVPSAIPQGRYSASHAPVRGGAHPLRVDTTTVLHAMAEGHEMMFDLAGRSELEVTEHVRERLERLSEARPDERKVLTLELLAGSMALAGAVA